jgi:hypothetical protein
MDEWASPHCPILNSISVLVSLRSVHPHFLQLFSRKEVVFGSGESVQIMLEPDEIDLSSSLEIYGVFVIIK